MNFTFPIDDAHNKDNNEYYRDSRRLLVSGIVFSVLLLVAAGATLFLGGTSGWALYAAIFLIVVGVFYLIVSVRLPASLDAPQDLYDNSPLCPAIIAEVDPRTMTLMALVDTRKDQSTGAPDHALTLRTVTKIHGVPRRVGARVPAVAVGGNHKGGNSFDQITPVPLAWATRDSSVVREAERAIAHNDWLTLQKSLDRVADIRATKNDLLALN